MTEFEIPARLRARRVAASWVLCCLQLAFSILHTHAPWAYRVDGRTSTGVVAYINSLGPVWAVLFGVTAVIMAGLLVIGEEGWWLSSKTWVGHLLCGVVFAAFTAALFTSAISNTPAGPFTYPTLAFFITFSHGILTLSYGGER